MQSLKEHIREKRPSLSASSLTTYDSILRNLYKRVFPDDEAFHIAKFDEADKFLAHLKEMAPAKRKTVLSALYVLSQNPLYRENMMTDISAYQTEVEKQEKTPSQQANWADPSNIQSIWADLRDNADLLYKKKNRTAKDMEEIQRYVLLSCLGGVLIAPRRSLDFCAFKIRNIDEDKDNFMQRRPSAFVFNSYKTAKTYGKQLVSIPLALQKIVTKWMTVNTSDFLLTDSKGQPLTSVKLNQRLNAIFAGKKISVNALRHSYLTEKYGSTIKQNEALAEDMAAMGSSKNVAVNYIKK